MVTMTFCALKTEKEVSVVSRHLKPQLIWLCVGVVVGTAIAVMAVRPVHRRNHDALQRQLHRTEQNQAAAEKALLALKGVCSALKDDHRSLLRRTTGHTVTDQPEVVSGKEQAPQEAYVQPTGLDGFKCSGVMGTIRSRKAGKFQQWVVSLPEKSAKGKRIRRADLDLPISKYYALGRPSVGGQPCVVTAEICPVMKTEGSEQGWDYALWVSAGHEGDGWRYIIPLGTIPSRSRERFVLTNSVPKRMAVENTADIELGRVIKRTLGEDAGDETIHILRIVLK
jgi:hypothetical protein